MEKIKVFYFLLLLIILLSNCNKQGKNEKPLNTTTSGEITISADEALMPIVEAEIKAFENIYKDAKINVIYSSEATALNKLLNYKVPLTISNRVLFDEEVEGFKEKGIRPKVTKIGINALALITHKDNPDTAISYETLQSLFKGEIKNWKQINKNSPLKDIKIIFDDDSAASVRYIKDSIAKVATLPSNCFALDTNPKVIDYVSENKESLGIIGVSWISDQDDEAVRGFLDKVKVLAISKAGDSKYADEYYQPYQAYIANKDYALNQSIYIINAEPRIGLASGFTAFVAGDKGQRIILKSGLVPATMPVRVVKINKNPIY